MHPVTHAQTRPDHPAIIMAASGETVTFGTSVGVADEDTDEESIFHIVGPYEADINRGLVSTSSPIAKGLIGKSVGDSAEVYTPGGVKSYEIISIELFDTGQSGEGRHPGVGAASAPSSPALLTTTVSPVITFPVMVSLSASSISLGISVF